MVRCGMYKSNIYYQDSNVCTKTEQNHGCGHFCNLKLIYFKHLVYTVQVEVWSEEEAGGHRYKSEM